MHRRIRYGRLWLAAAGLFLAAPAAQAVPSFARQTNMACSACHQSGTFPELNSFGRRFKLGGYSMFQIKDIEAGPDSGGKQLSLIDIPLISAMVQASATHTRKAQSGVQNNSTAFPQQLSLFLAGRITPHVGTFIQATKGGGDSSFEFDLGDVRFADDTSVGGQDLLYGVTLNNAPTLEDPWNSTPVWSFPWASSEQAPGAAASTLLDGDVLGEVAGLGAYGMLNNHWYADVSTYRSSGTSDASSQNVIKNAAPYWRLAYDRSFGGTDVMVGTFGMNADLYPAGITGPTDSYRDLAVDTQIEQPVGAGALTFHGAYIDERREPAAGDSVTYRHLRADGTYHTGAHIRATVGYSTLDTGGDHLDTSDWVAQLGYFPWQNVDLSLQYKAYTKFDGDTRDASDNDTTYVMAWLAF